VVLINFWFATCAPCITEFDALNELHRKLQKEKRFEFIAFTFENTMTVKKIRERYGLKFKIVSISRDECQRLGLNNGYPTNIVIDKMGKIKYVLAGGATTKETAETQIMNHIYPAIIEELKSGK
jgi:peroxiredoxin